MRWHKADWRKHHEAPHAPHLVVRWFHWSWRPRVYICYYDGVMMEQRHKALDFKDCDQIKGRAV